MESPINAITSGTFAGGTPISSSTLAASSSTRSGSSGTLAWPKRTRSASTHKLYHVFAVGDMKTSKLWSVACFASAPITSSASNPVFHHRQVHRPSRSSDVRMEVGRIDLRHLWTLSFAFGEKFVAKCG